LIPSERSTSWRQREGRAQDREMRSRPPGCSSPRDRTPTACTNAGREGSSSRRRVQIAENGPLIDTHALPVPEL